MNGRDEQNIKYINRSKEMASTMPQEISEYVEQSLVNMQPKTVFGYTEMTMYFLKDYAEKNNINLKDIKLNQINENDARRYFRKINTKKDKEGNEVKTSASYYRTNWFALHSVFDFLEKEGVVENNIINETENRKVGRRVKKYNYLNQIEIQKLLSILREPYNLYLEEEEYPDPVAIRDMVMIEIYLQTGMRLSALTQLKMDDVDLENGILYVIDKGDKVFEHKIPPQLVEHLKYYIEESRYDIINSKTYDTDYVFFSTRTGKSISRNRMYQIVQHYTELAGNRVSPHKLRSTYALTLYDKTKDAILVQHKMGHSSLKTTMAYINHVSDEKKEMADKVIADLLF